MNNVEQALHQHQEEKEAVTSAIEMLARRCNLHLDLIASVHQEQGADSTELNGIRQELLTGWASWKSDIKSGYFSG